MMELNRWIAKAIGRDPLFIEVPDIAAKIMRDGMVEGWFTGKRLGDYLQGSFATLVQYQGARRIINGTDKAALIAGYAIQFESALAKGGWA